MGHVYTRVRLYVCMYVSMYICMHVRFRCIWWACMSLRLCSIGMSVRCGCPHVCLCLIGGRVVTCVHVFV